MDFLARRAARVGRRFEEAGCGSLPRWCVLVPLAALCGASWSCGNAAALSPLVVIVWWRARGRLEAMAVGASYQLGVTWWLTSAASRWFEISYAKSAAVVVAGAIAVGVSWGVVSPAECKTLKSAIAAVLVWVALTITPIGVGALMVGHPLIAAGWWFPGAGWMGLFLLLVLLVGARTRQGAWVMVLWSMVAVAVAASKSPVPIPGVGVVDTESPPSHGELDFLGQYRVAREALSRAELERAPLVVLPEGAGGTWTRSMRGLWAPYSTQLAREGRSALVGAALQGARLENVVVGLGRADGLMVHQRLPIPAAMWRPWDTGGFEVRPWDDGLLEIDGKRFGVLVCWEGGLVWPVLRSMVAGAQSLVLVANHAWTGPRSETRTALGAWSALFSVPVAMAENVWRQGW